MLKWLVIKGAVELNAQNENLRECIVPDFESFQKGIRLILDEADSLEPSVNRMFLKLLYAELTAVVIDFKIALGLLKVGSETELTAEQMQKVHEQLARLMTIAPTSTN